MARVAFTLFAGTAGSRANQHANAITGPTNLRAAAGDHHDVHAEPQRDGNAHPASDDDNSTSWWLVIPFALLFTDYTNANATSNLYDNDTWQWLSPSKST